jgi:nicotinamide riboside kinase
VIATNKMASMIWRGYPSSPCTVTQKQRQLSKARISFLLLLLTTALTCSISCRLAVLMSSRESTNHKPPCIYIIGAQCTGKTTLVDALQRYFQAPDNCSWNGHNISPPQIIKEVARNVLREHHFIASDITSSKTRALSLQKLILDAQLTAERKVKSGWFISDRSGLDPLVYASRYVGEDAAKELMESAEWSELKVGMKRSLVIVCEPGVAWLSDDGVRLMPENEGDWIIFHKTFCTFLEEMSIKHKVLSNSVADQTDRISFVVRSWTDEASPDV